MNTKIRSRYVISQSIHKKNIYILRIAFKDNMQKKSQEELQILA